MVNVIICDHFIYRFISCSIKKRGVHDTETSSIDRVLPTQLMYGRLETAVSKTDSVAVSVMRFKTTQLPTQSVKEPLPLEAKSSCVYQLQYKSLAAYIKRMQRQVSIHVVEHISMWEDEKLKLKANKFGNYV